MAKGWQRGGAAPSLGPAWTLDIVLPWATATKEGEEGWEREQRFLGEAEGLTGAVVGLRKIIRMNQG